MFCSKCGAIMVETNLACPRCGAPVSSPQPQPASAPAAAAPAPATSTASTPWQGVPPARPYAGQPQTDGKAVGSLILGILAIFPFGFLAGIPAVILGHLSRKSVRESLGRLQGEGMALAGLIMGYVSVVAIPMILIIAAIAIPSLLRSRMLANESAAATTVRTLNTSQFAYADKYPSVGYAHDLATLGTGPAMNCTAGVGTVEHACLIDRPLGNPICTAGSWCVRYGYKFDITATCGSDGVCSDYVVVATPVQPGTTGFRSFCSTSDQVVRGQSAGSVQLPLPADACQLWPPL